MEMKKTAGVGFGRGMNIRKQRLLLELVYIFCTLVIVVLAVFAFIYQEKASFLYPVIFVLAAAMNILTGVRYVQRDTHNRRHTVPALLFFALALALLLMAAAGLIIML